MQDGRSAGFAEVATSDDETGLETGRAVAEVTRFQTGEASASSLPPSKAKKLHHAEGVAKSPESKNRYAAGDLSETGEEPGSKAATGEDNWAASGEKGWAFLVNEVVSKVRELADRDDEGSGNGKRKKKVVVRALGEKADGEDADGAIWTEVSEKDVGGIGRGGRFWGKTDRGEGESSSDGSGSDGAGGNGRPTVLGSGIGTMKEDGTTDVIPTGSDVRERFDEFFANGGGEMVDEKGRPTRWSAEVREFVEKGGYENGAAAIRAKKQETIWKGTRDFLERWGRESENGNGSGNGASVSGRGKVGVLENGKFVKFFDTGNGHHAGDREGGGVKSMSGENHNNGRGARMRGRANEGRTDDERGEFASGRTAVLERTESKDTGSRVSETSSSNEQSAEATESRIVDKNKSEAAAGQVNPVAIVIVAVAVALLLAWGHVQAIKIATLPFSG